MRLVIGNWLRLGCYSKLPLTGQLKQQTCIYTALGAVKSKINVLADLVSAERLTASWFADGPLLTMPSCGEQKEGSKISSVSYKDANPIS